MFTFQLHNSKRDMSVYIHVENMLALAGPLESLGVAPCKIMLGKLLWETERSPPTSCGIE